MRTRFPIRTALPPVRLGCVISLFLVSVVPYGDAGSSSVGAVQIAGLNVHIVTSKEQGQCKTDCEMTPFLQGYMDLPDSQVMLFDITDGAQLASEMTEKYKSIADEAVRHGIADKTFIITSYDDLDLGNGDGRSKVTTALKNAVDQGVRLLGLRNTLPNVQCQGDSRCTVGIMDDLATGGKVLGQYTCSIMPQDIKNYVAILGYGKRTGGSCGTVSTAFYNSLKHTCPSLVDFNSLEWINTTSSRSEAVARRDMAQAMLGEPRTRIVFGCFDPRAQYTIEWLHEFYGDSSTKSNFIVLGRGRLNSGVFQSDALLKTGDMAATLDPGFFSAHGQHVKTYPTIINALAGGLTVRPVVYTPVALVTRDPAGMTLENLLEGYKSSVAPNGVKVEMSFDISNLGDVDMRTQTFQLSGWMHSSWKDPRLTYMPWDILWLESISINEGSVWDPRIAIIETVPHTLKTVSSKSGGVQMQIFPNGLVQKSVWISTQIGCEMQLSMFPRDVQVCTVTGFSPMRMPVSINPALVNISGKQPLFSIVETFEPDASNSMHMVITFRRKMESYFIVYVMPAMMMACTAIGQFWVVAMPARVALAIISFLALSNLMTSASAQLPQTGETSWLENFLMFNIIVLWLCLAETILSGVEMFQRKLPDGPGKQTDSTPQPPQCQSPPKNKTAKYNVAIKKIDEISLSSQSPDCVTVHGQTDLSGLVETEMVLIPDGMQLHLHKAFKRYILNRSGRIDTLEELQQLAVNLLCELNIPAQHVTTTLDAAMGAVLADTEEGLTEDQFQVWFSSLMQDIQEATSPQTDADVTVRVVPSPRDKPEVPDSLLLSIAFPSRSHNWPDSCAKVWLPVLYVLTTAIMLLQLAV